MTLQYSPRSMSDDRKWFQRVRLCNCLLVETVDWWCRSDNSFPISDSVDAILHIFSPRIDPWSILESNVRSSLANVMHPAVKEYSLVWPHRDPQMTVALSESISTVLKDAEHAWSNGSMLDPAIEAVNEQITEVIVAQKYFVFHHNQTTSRDGGGFHGQG